MDDATKHPEQMLTARELAERIKTRKERQIQKWLQRGCPHVLVPENGCQVRRARLQDVLEWASKQGIDLSQESRRGRPSAAARRAVAASQQDAGVGVDAAPPQRTLEEEARDRLLEQVRREFRESPEFERAVVEEARRLSSDQDTVERFVVLKVRLTKLVRDIGSGVHEGSIAQQTGSIKDLSSEIRLLDEHLFERARERGDFVRVSVARQAFCELSTHFVTILDNLCEAMADAALDAVQRVPGGDVEALGRAVHAGAHECVSRARTRLADSLESLARDPQAAEVAASLEPAA